MSSRFRRGRRSPTREAGQGTGRSVGFARAAMIFRPEFHLRPGSTGPHRAPRRRRREEPAVGVSLSKGGNLSLPTEPPGLPAVTVGPGGDVRPTTGADFDLDASAIALKPDGKVLSDQHF